MVSFGEFYDKKKTMSNLIILDNSGILCTSVVIRLWFTCLLVNSRGSGNTSLLRNYKVVTLVYYVITKWSRQCWQKTKCLKVKGKVFYGQEPPSGESATTECGVN